MRRRRAALVAAMLLLAAAAADCVAIEMFTFFGDGSRIGLPSLEVPVEAYPGIPLRSDRIRARRRQAVMRAGQAGLPAGVTLRAMPTPAPTARQPLPMPPEPEDVLPRR